MSAPAVSPSLLETTAPVLEAREAAAIAFGVFGIAGVAEALTSERDRNFRIRGAAGHDFVLKVTNAAEDPGVSAFQTAALRHIECCAPELPVARLRASLDGQVEPVVRLAAGTRHVVRLLTYLPGEPLYRTEPSRPQTEALARCLAALGIALSTFHHPSAVHDILWDLSGAARLRPYLGHIADRRCRQLADAGLARFETATLPRLAGLRRQVVHNDFNPHNVLVDPHRPDCITGVLDFGDMVETALIADVAIAASYQAEGPDAMERIVGFVAAYHTVRALLPGEVEVLFDLIVLRQVMTVTIAQWRASLYPDNAAYILRNQPRAAAALDILDGVGRIAGTARLRRACAMEA